MPYPRMKKAPQPILACPNKDIPSKNIEPAEKTPPHLVLGNKLCDQHRAKL